jgi:DeoR/GlpR family transcriptional regulator of sugar metabolism
MYAAERRQAILELLEEEDRVSVTELASQFCVSPASIRRDLNHLYESGLLNRTYGGALRLNSTSHEVPFDERKVSFFEEKDRIGRQAASLVTPGETVFVDGGTTTECMVPYLANKACLTVVTCGLNIVSRLMSCEHITVIVVGGTLYRNSHILGGILALNYMQAYNMRFDKAFVAAGGIAAEGGVTNASFEEIPIKRRAIESAHQAILLADSSKVGTIATGLIVPAAGIHRLVTGRHALLNEVEGLRALGIVVDLI